VLGDYVHQANYRAGYNVLKIGDLSNAEFSEEGYFDIFPSSDSTSFNAAWSNYPYFPSGSVVVSGIEQGLFVLKFNAPFPTISPAPSTSPAPTQECPVSFFLSLLTDDYASETSWEVTDNNSGSVVLSGDSYVDDTLYEIDECVPYGCYTFTILDSFGDGICCAFGQGSYSLTIDGTLVGSGGDFGSDETIQFCGNAPPSDCYDSTLQVNYQGSVGGCSDLAANPSSICATNIVAQSHCPVTCDACATYGCEDSLSNFIFQGGTYTCADLAAQSQADIDNYCQNPAAFTTCRATCGICA